MAIITRMTTDKELAKQIQAKLRANKKKYGKRYCPCVPEYMHSDDTVCMCKEFRDMKTGTCHCGLFVKEEDPVDEKN